MKEKGSDGFSIEYWEKNYAEPLEMDNISNSLEHAKYLQALFELEQIEIGSVIDLGFGLGYLFEKIIEIFAPYRACAIEPSEYAFKQAKKRIGKVAQVKKLEFINTDLINWAKKLKASEKPFDLGICTSVFQYLTDKEIEFILPILAKQVRYLYFSVPTDLEYRRQIAEYDFFDEYSIHRTREQYLAWISKHFTIVSSRLLESKYYFDDDSSHFKEQIFRH